MFSLLQNTFYMQQAALWQERGCVFAQWMVWHSTERHTIKVPAKCTPRHHRLFVKLHTYREWGLQQAAHLLPDKQIPEVF